MKICKYFSLLSSKINLRSNYQDQEVEEVVKPQETRTVQQDAIPVSVDKKEPTFTFLPNGVRAKKYTERQERLLKDAVAAFVYMINRKSLVRQRWRKWKTTVS